MISQSGGGPYVRLQTVLVCHTNRYWQLSVSSTNSGRPTPACGLQWNMMVDETVLDFSRPHLESDGTITSRFPPGGQNGSQHMKTLHRREEKNFVFISFAI